jgi:hypothetical protein
MRRPEAGQRKWFVKAEAAQRGPGGIAGKRRNSLGKIFFLHPLNDVFS